MPSDTNALHRIKRTTKALAVAANKQIIVWRWRYVGFFLIIKNKEVEKIQLEHDIVLNKLTLKNKSTHGINESERGKKTEFWEYCFLIKG